MAKEQKTAAEIWQNSALNPAHFLLAYRIPDTHSVLNSSCNRKSTSPRGSIVDPRGSVDLAITGRAKPKFEKLFTFCDKNRHQFSNFKLKLKKRKKAMPYLVVHEIFEKFHLKK